jgi:NitT/TauT family transport system substrate-binding protein
MSKKLSLLILLFALVCTLSVCTRPPNAVVLQREWTANAEFAGDVWASEIAAARGINLEVREGSQVIDPIKMVRSNSVQFGVASSDRVLRENEGGAGLVILAAASYRSPVVFLVNPARGIMSPTDFRGHTIGIQAGTNTELVFKTLVQLQHLSPDMKVVESGWGTTTFETGALDVLAAFEYDEPIQLDLKNVKYSAILPEDHGVHFVGAVFFASKDFVAKNPKVVQDFIDDLVSGWEQALAHPKEAIQKLSTRFRDVNAAKEALSLERGRPYFSGENGRLLYASQERWNKMAQQLISLGVLKSFDFRDNVDYRFLDEALSKRDAKR